VRPTSRSRALTSRAHPCLYATTIYWFTTVQGYSCNLSLQFRNTSFDKLAFDSRERVERMIRPALLKTLSLAAELAGTVKIFRARGLRALNRLSFRTDWPSVTVYRQHYFHVICRRTPSSEKWRHAYCRVSTARCHWDVCWFWRWLITIIVNRLNYLGLLTYTSNTSASSLSNIK